MQKIEIGKEDALSKLLAKALNPKNVEIKKRLNSLTNFRNFGLRNDGNLSPPTSPPAGGLPPQPPPFLPPKNPNLPLTLSNLKIFSPEKKGGTRTRRNKKRI